LISFLNLIERAYLQFRMAYFSAPPSTTDHGHGTGVACIRIRYGTVRYRSIAAIVAACELLDVKK